MDSRNLEVLNKHLKAENQHDMEATLATLHPECIFEDIALNQIYSGRQGAGDYYKLWWEAFDLIVVSEKRYFTDNETIIAEPRYTGTHIGNFYGLAPTGKKIDFKLAVIISFRDGFLSGERMYYDSRTLLIQLGADNFPMIKT